MWQCNNETGPAPWVWASFIIAWPKRAGVEDCVLSNGSVEV